jgi:hypothetical protein
MEDDADFTLHIDYLDGKNGWAPPATAVSVLRGGGRLVVDVADDMPDNCINYQHTSGKPPEIVFGAVQMRGGGTEDFRDFITGTCVGTCYVTIEAGTVAGSTAPPMYVKQKWVAGICVEETFIGDNEFKVDGTTPSMAFIERDWIANNKYWDWFVDAGVFKGRVVNDLLNSATNWIEVTRSGNSITSIALGGPTTVPDDVYAIGWNNSPQVPTKNAVYDKIESLPIGALTGASYVVESADATLTAEVLIGELTNATELGWADGPDLTRLNSTTLLVENEAGTDGSGTIATGDAYLWDPTLGGYSIITVDAGVFSLLDATPAPAGLEIGGLTVPTINNTTLTAFGMSLWDDANATAALNTLGASSGVWPASAGGTGASTLMGLVVGNGASAFTTITPGTGVTAALGSNTSGSGPFVRGTNGVLNSPQINDQIVMANDNNLAVVHDGLDIAVFSGEDSEIRFNWPLDLAAPLPVAEGGTGATDAAGARHNLELDSPVIRRESDGDIFLYGQDAANSTAVGTAIIAAQTAASSGDVIEVHANATITTSLGKGGVDWWFASVGVIGSGVPVWSDGGTGMTFAVDGMGAFASTGAAPCVSLLDNSSVVTIRGRLMQNSAGADACIELEGATLYVTLHESLNGDGADGVVGAGTLYITCPTLDCFDNCYEFSGTLHAVHTGYLHSGNATINGSFTGELSCPDIAPSGDDPAVVWQSDLAGEIRSATLGGGGSGVPSVSLEEDGLTLSNCKIAADSAATYSIEDVGGPHTLTVLGSLSCNKPIDAGVTIAQATTFIIPALPTSEPATVGALWNDGGTVKVSNGP